MERVQTSLTEGIKPWVFLDRIITSIEYIKKKDVIHSALARETFWDLIVVDEAHYVAESGTPRNPYATARTRLGLELREACYGLILLTATPHNGHRHSFRSLLELVEPTDATFEGDRDVVRRRISRNMIRRLKPQIFKTGPDGSRIPAFPPREPVRQIPVDNLSGDERLIFKRVSAYCAKTAREARGTDESDLVGFAMQIVKKRMLSSRSALSVTVANRLEALKTRIQEDEAPSRAEVRELSGDLPLTESAHERIAQRILRGSVPRDAKRRAAEKKQLASIAGLLERVSKRPDPKIMALIDDLKRDVLPDPDEKAIIFTEYRDTLAAIREAFNNDATLAGTFAELTGGLSAKQRQLKIACFEQADTRFLLATDAASEGLNLQHRCRRIYHVELPWNPNRLEQRNGRVDRHGQKRNPIVRYLFYPDSPEDGVLSGIVRKILEMQQDRVSTPDIIGIVSAADIEALRVIDPACGSGHFLIGAARYLGRRLHAAYRREYKDDPPSPFYPDRPLTAAIREQWAREGEAWCKRRIIEKCLFGVDLNPTAVQLAQVALWIESLAGDRPLSFFAHHVRAGNSLLGTWVANLGNPVLRAAETAEQSAQLEMFTHDTDAQIARALDERLLIDAPMPPDVRPDTPGEYRYKQDRLANAENQVKKARLLFDLRNASAFIPDIRKIWWSLLRMPDPESYARGQPWWDEFVACTREQRFFHWELEFPEIFRTAGGGFDAVLGNPPWEKIKPDRKEFYGRADILIRAYTGGELDARIRELHAAHPGLQTAFDDYSATVKTLAACLKKGDDYRFCDWLIDGKSTGGDPDLFKFFVERAHRILRPGGRLGFLVPSAVYNNEGCTGMRHLILDQSRVITFYGFENRRKIFPIHSSYKFVCLTLEKRSESTMEDNLAETEFQAAFMRHDVEELAKAAPSQSDSSAATLTPACAASLGAAGRP